MIKKRLKATFIIVIASLLFSLSFLFTPISLVNVQPLDPYPEILSTLGEYLLGDFGLVLLPYMVFLPIVVYIATLLARGKQYRNAKRFLGIAGVVMGMATVYVLVLVMWPFVMQFVPFSESRWSLDPQYFFGFLIFFWMTFWTFFALVSSLPSKNHIYNALDKRKRLIVSVSWPFFILILCSFIANVVGIFLEIRFEFWSFLQLPFLAIQNGMAISLGMGAGGSTISFWPLILAMIFLMGFTIIPIVVFLQKDVLGFSKEWLWVLGAFLLSVASLYYAGVVSMLFSTLYGILAISKEIPSVIFGVDFVLGVFVLFWGQVVALCIVLLVLREKLPSTTRAVSKEGLEPSRL